mgnify:CR=1 FL=1
MKLSPSTNRSSSKSTKLTMIAIIFSYINDMIIMVLSNETNKSNNNNDSEPTSESSTQMRDQAYEICRKYLSGEWNKISSDDMIFKTVRFVFYSFKYFEANIRTNEKSLSKFFDFFSSQTSSFFFFWLNIFWVEFLGASFSSGFEYMHTCSVFVMKDLIFFF